MLNNERITLKHVSLNLDILPERYRRKRISFKQVLVLLCTVVGVALLVLLYQVALDAMNATSTLREEVDFLNVRIQLQRMTASEQAVMTSLIDEYDVIDDKRVIVYQDMVVIKDAADQIGIAIASIRCESDKIVINCPSDGYATYDDYRDTFESYYQALLQTGRFASVERPPTDWSPSSLYIRIDVTH